MAILKGQNFRVIINEKYVAGATSCNVHVAANLEDVTTKDNADSWQDQEVVSKSWDGSVDALVVLGDSASTSILGLSAIDLVGSKLDIEFTEANGDNNRTAKSGGIKYTGQAIINDMSQTHGNRANSTYSLSFTGVGALTKTTIS